MKIRIKFAKTGVMKFVGHLDVMRYFQKAIRRAELPIAYSEGFSPHMLLSFASPLGVGISSTGEYFDMVLAEDMKTDEIVKRLNATMVEGMEVLSARHVPDGKASKAMSLVAGADYLVQFREGKMPEIDLETKVPVFFALPQIEIMRKTKRSEKLTDIRPWIYDMKAKKSGVWMQLSTGSVSNLKPELVMEAFCKWCGVELPPFAYTILREEVYADIGTEEERKLVPLEALGEEVEYTSCHCPSAVGGKRLPGTHAGGRRKTGRTDGPLQGEGNAAWQYLCRPGGKTGARDPRGICLVCGAAELFS